MYIWILSKYFYFISYYIINLESYNHFSKTIVSCDLHINTAELMRMLYI